MSHTTAPTPSARHSSAAAGPALIRSASGADRSPAPSPLTVATGRAVAAEHPLSRRRLVLRVFLVALAVAVLVMLVGETAARKIAESEAISAVAVESDGIAVKIVQPVLGDDIVRGNPADVQRLRGAIDDVVNGLGIARVKVFTASGTIVYSNERRLIGEHFALDSGDRETLLGGRTKAEISNLDDPDNRFERGHGPLLEVSRAIHTPNGTRLLFELYYPYNDVLTSSQRIWFGFAAVIGASLILFLVALLPLLNSLVRSVERAREERERSLLKALDASDAERRRIAGAVHDGPVQDLVGASYRLGAVAGAAQGTELAIVLDAAESAINTSVEGLRSMLVDLYPPTLSEGGIRAALSDLVGAARSRGAVVVLRVDDDLRMSAEAERLVFRIARETIANAVKHGGGTPVTVQVQQAAEGAVLSVADTGSGFDAEETLRNPPAGHFGMRLLQDAVIESGADATLTVETARGRGTVWRLVVA